MKNKRHIIFSTVLTFILSIGPMLIVKSELPDVVPIHWDMDGNVNGSLSQVAFVYGTPIVMTLMNLLGCYKYGSKYSEKPVLYYIIPVVCSMITILMIYLALR